MPQKVPQNPKRPARQQPGLACEECRKRKARCDRAKPQCGSCMMTGRVCIVNFNRPRRGPKKGQIESLYSRLELLEEQVVEKMDSIAPGYLSLQTPTSQSSNSASSTFSQSESQLPYLLPYPSPSGVPNLSAPTPQPLIPESRIDLVQADLDQLYFDRVHAIVPFIHQRRYASRTETEPPSLARACLRSAMRTVAAAMSAQFRRLSDSLYVETSRVLNELDTIETSPPLEQIQALLLLAHYELLRMDESRAMSTAAKCFRLIQVSRLHDTDAYNAGFSGTNVLDFVGAEERRRTFWVAYCFDRMLSSRHEWALTLQEEAIWTRLPAPETTFQAGQPPSTQMDFLQEAISTSGQKALSPFAESIVLATLYGRTMNLRRMALLSTLDTHQFWNRHRALASIIEKRVHLWSWMSASQMGVFDSVVGFVHVLGRVGMMYIGEVEELARGEIFGTEDLPDPETQQRALQMVDEFMALIRVMYPMNCFKAHPFLPNVIARAAAYISRNASFPAADEPGISEVGELRQTLRGLQVTNNLAKEVLGELSSL